MKVENGKLKVISYSPESALIWEQPRCSAGPISFYGKRNGGKKTSRDTTFPDALPGPLRRQDGLSARLDGLATRLYPPPITTATHGSLRVLGLAVVEGAQKISLKVPTVKTR